MKINEKELQTIIEYGFNSILKPYSISFYEFNLEIKETIEITGKLNYNGKSISIMMKCLFEYSKGILKVNILEYSALYMKINIPILNILKNINTYKDIKIIDNIIMIDLDLPIHSFEIKDNNFLIYINEKNIQI